MQTKKKSLIEQFVRTTINYVLSCLSYYFIFEPSPTNWIKGLYFVGLSIITGYIIRRIFTDSRFIEMATKKGLRFSDGLFIQRGKEK